MKILVIGGEGTIGKKVVSYLSKNHSIITAGRKNGEIYLDSNPISNIPPHKRGIGMVFQNYALFPS